MTDTSRLSPSELTDLVRRVFRPSADDTALALLVDLPDDALPDNPDWAARRVIAAGWARALKAAASDHGLAVDLFWYRNVRTNNADLPARMWPGDAVTVPESCSQVDGGEEVDLERVLASHQLAMAPTELSATAPLKVLAREHGFRAATMPGFSPAMVPALRLDYLEVDRRVQRLKQLLDPATGADLELEATGTVHQLHLDLRHRPAHASGGLLHTPGTAGNLPSGETYIVPYEGEVVGDPTRSEGALPVEMDGEVVVHRIEGNRAVEILSDGPVSSARREELAAEPAAANLAELGLGVLADFGLRPIGEVLLDEKLGLHLAFGRSDHFGGQVGPSDFSRPEAVIHQDWVYLPEIQPQVRPRRLTISGPDGETALIRDGSWVFEF